MNEVIQKLDAGERRPAVIVEKLNELVDAYNTHYHESLDTHYKTTWPKQSSPDDETS